VLKIARQAYYRWLAQPVTAAEWTEAHLANALFDAHRDDPEFGYRFLADEARDAGHVLAERTAWRICSDNGWWSTFGKRRRSKKTRVGAPAHDDLVRREFIAPGPNLIWLSDRSRAARAWAGILPGRQPPDQPGPAHHGGRAAAAPQHRRPPLLRSPGRRRQDTDGGNAGAP
jgi:hypothetical protein